MKTISRILILAMLHLCWLTSYGYAEMIPTESSIEQPSTSNTDRQRLLDLLDRQEVVEELEKYGITKVEAIARINSLTDEEVVVIAGKLDELAAGGIVKEFVSILFGLILLPIALLWAITCFSYMPMPGSAWCKEFDCDPDTCFDFIGYSWRSIVGESKAVPYEGVPYEGDDCDPRMESCSYSSGEEEEESDSVPVEEVCDPGMESCI